MKRPSDRLLALALALFMFAGAGCGYFLYPERRGRTKGRIDTPVLIMDILWFLPGIIPGVVALAVDFSSGAIYEGGGRASLGTGTKLVIRRPKVERPTRYDIELRTKGGRMIAADGALARPGDDHRAPLDLDIGDAARRYARAQGRTVHASLALRVDGHLTATRQIQIDPR